METDAERLRDGARLETDLCIIGTGPAGITVARELQDDRIDVLLLESGGWNAEDWPQSLNEGAVRGDVYAGLRSTRHRQIGGTTALWNTPGEHGRNAKYVPLDPADLDAWPIRWADLLPFYEQAQRLAGLGPFRYEGTDWIGAGATPLDLGSGALTSRVYQFGPSRAVVGDPLSELRRKPNVRLCYHATVVALSTDPGGERVTEARIRCRTGQEISVRARAFVLAAGAIENARLLLVSSLGNRSGWVGRSFMEHPRDRGVMSTTSPWLDRLTFYDSRQMPGGFQVGGRLAPVETALRERSLPGFSVTVLPILRASPAAPGVVRRAVRRLRRIVYPPPSAGYGWSRVSRPERWFEGVGLLLNLEQRPHPENRVVLGSDTDALGVPRAELAWRWRPEDQAGLTQCRTLVSEALEAGGVGLAHFDPSASPDPNAHHHAGTTRMSGDWQEGVVDSNERVHGTENLYVTGSSVFPTAGFANPTLTVLALSARLAGHLRGLLVPGP